jgi:hypothetical protein
MSEGTDATAESSVLSPPKGGGAVGGMGEKFAADLFSGTGSARSEGRDDERDTP